MKKLLAGVVACLAASGCASSDSYLQQAQWQTGQFSPQVDGLLARNQSILQRAQKLPPGLDGASDAVARLGANKTTLDALKGDLSGFSGKVDSTVKGGDSDGAKAMVASHEESSTHGLLEARAELDKVDWIVRGLESRGGAAPAHAAAPPAREEPAPAPAPTPTVYSKALPSGYMLTGNLTGIEAQLVAFIEDSGRPVDKTTWFNFDRLNFRFGSSELDMNRSMEQLTNVAEILRAFPAVKLKIGGYTDNVGKPAANMKLSAERARRVTEMLVNMGIVADRLEPEGYGQEHPECPANDTEECRARNRRIAVRVTTK